MTKKKGALPAKETKEKAGSIKKNKEPQESGSFVYCGPSVRGVAQQYTVFSGGMPGMLKEFTDKHPVAKSLIVPVEKFPETRRNLETKGTAEQLIYNKLRSELKSGL